MKISSEGIQKLPAIDEASFNKTAQPQQALVKLVVPFQEWKTKKY